MQGIKGLPPQPYNRGCHVTVVKSHEQILSCANMRATSTILSTPAKCTTWYQLRKMYRPLPHFETFDSRSVYVSVLSVRVHRDSVSIHCYVDLVNEKTERLSIVYLGQHLV